VVLAVAEALAWYPYTKACEKTNLYLYLKQYNIFLTPRDFHPHFKHIIHRALVTRERGINPPRAGTSAACAASTERPPHTLVSATPSEKYSQASTISAMPRRKTSLPTDDSSRTRQAKRILFACPGEGAPKSTIDFMIILWKYILIQLNPLVMVKKVPVGNSFKELILPHRRATSVLQRSTCTTCP
jgi:hypothetical protein